MTREEQIDWLYRLRADLNNGTIFAPWKKEFTEALTGVLDQEPCEDVISREDTLKAMIEQLGIRNEDYLIPAEATLYKVVKNMPPVIPQPKIGHWVPISERLPEDRREVLVTAYWHETYQVMMASYYGDGLWWCVPFNNCGEHTQRLNPKAWMPLPEPYKAD